MPAAVRWLAAGARASLLAALLLAACRPAPAQIPQTAATQARSAPASLQPSATLAAASETEAPAPSATAPAPSLPTATPFVPRPATSTPPPTPSPVPGRQVIQLDPWDLVNAVAWSPDGTVLAAAAGEELLLCQAQPLQVLRAVRLGAFTHSLAFSPDGARLAAASRDGGVRVWRLASLLAEDGPSRPELVIEAHAKGADSVAFSPDGRWLASGGNDAVVRVWDSETGERVQQVIGGTYAVPSVAFSPDGRLLAIANGQVIRLRELEGGRILGTLRAEEASLYSLAFSPDGRWIAAGDNDNGLWVWPVPQEAERDSPEPRYWRGHQGRSGSPAALVWQVAFRPQDASGPLLLASAAGDGTVRLWDASTGDPAGVLEGHTAAVTGLAFSPDGLRLATSSLDGSLRLWQLP